MYDNMSFNVSNFLVVTNSTLDYENELEVALAGNTALLVLFMLFGSFGNCLVLFVYKDYKFSNKLDDRRFIPYLALMDFMASLASSCQYMIENGYPLRYPGSLSCKVLTFTSLLPASISGMILLAIAFHRYKRVCNPFSRLHITQTQTIAMTAVGGLVISFPSLVFSDITFFFDIEHGINATKCLRLSPTLKTSSSVYSSFIAALCVGGILFIIVSYSLVGVRIKRQYSLAQSTIRTTPANDIDETSEDLTASTFSLSTVATKDMFWHTKDYKTHSTFYLDDIDKAENSSCVPSSMNTLETTLKKKKKRAKQTRFIQRKRARFLRFTWMFVIMSAVYCCSLLPRVIVRVLEMAVTNFWFKLDRETLVAMTFLARIYIISFIVNPVIYGFFDNKFRKKCKRLLKNCNCYLRVTTTTV